MEEVCHQSGFGVCGEREMCVCAIMWSLGNEAGYGAAHDAAAAWLRRQDSSRPVHYEVGCCSNPVCVCGREGHVA
jgi:hypothetical protein